MVLRLKAECSVRHCPIAWLAINPSIPSYISFTLEGLLLPSQNWILPLTVMRNKEVNNVFPQPWKSTHFILPLLLRAWTWFWTKAIILIWNEKAFKALLTQQHKGKGQSFLDLEMVPSFLSTAICERAGRTSNANDHQETLFVKKISIMRTSSEVSMSWCDSFCQLKRILYPCSEAEINGKACWVNIMEAFLASKTAHPLSRYRRRVQ